MVSTVVRSFGKLYTVPTSDVYLYAVVETFNAILVGNKVLATGPFCSIRFGVLQ